MSKKIAMLGLGAMGSRVAKNLLDAGFSVTVYNRTPERAAALQAAGAEVATTPKEATEQCDIVISMVTNDEASQQIWFDDTTGAIHALTPEKIAMESSTLSMKWTQDCAQIMKEKGFRFLDAPVVGTRPQADAKQLVYLVGGRKADHDSLADVYPAVAAKAVYLGENGSGAAMKLAINSLFGIQAAAFAELFSGLLKFGFAKEDMMRILPELPVTSPIMKVVLGLMAEDKFAPMFPIELVEKDFGYSEAFLQELGLDPIVVSGTRKAYQKAMEGGFGKDNISGIIQAYR